MASGSFPRSDSQPSGWLRTAGKFPGIRITPRLVYRLFYASCGCLEGNWSGRRDSNPRPQPWQGCALPLSYTRSPTLDRGSNDLVDHRANVHLPAEETLTPWAPDREALFARLHELGIPTTTVEHPPMFTVEQSASLRDATSPARIPRPCSSPTRTATRCSSSPRTTRGSISRRWPSGSSAGRFSFAKANCSRPCSVLQPVRLRRWR